MAVCVSCGFENPPGMRFCGNCGAKLTNLPGEPAATSLTAGLASEARRTYAKDTGELVERYRRSSSEATGQRRSVTILFADLTGYTLLASQHDSEYIYELVQRFIHPLIDDVLKYEGFVDKLTGDGVMALFGAPISHENNAERAVRAAMEMQRSLDRLNQQLATELDLPLQIRVGLHAGSVVVGGIGTGMVMEYTAIGDTVNLARRLQEMAKPGDIWVSESVYRQTSRLIEYEPLAEMTLRGIPQPVYAYRVIAEKPTPEPVRGIEGLHSPLVGRDKEIEQLTSLVHELSFKKRGKLVVVTGEAGIGKSRLAVEVKKRITHLPVKILQASSLTYRRSVSYWLFLDLLRGYFSIQPGQTETESASMLQQSVEKVMGAQAENALPYLEYLLSIKPSNPTLSERIRYLDAGQLRQQIFLTVRDLLIAEARRQPLLIILEDLHWADEASMDLLTYLLDLVRQESIIIYIITRPFQGGALSKIVDWADKHLPGQYHFIRLPSLSEAQSTHLLISLLTIPDLPEDLRFMILKRSAGIPFYLEEILRMLIDKGILQHHNGKWHVDAATNFLELGVPDTLQGLILARFDRLSAEQRRLLQIASVIGNQFRLDLLERLIPNKTPTELSEILTDLVDKDYLLKDSEFSDRYVFRHVLMSEAIYQTLLKRERSSLHGQVGEGIETLYPHLIEEQVELLARHFSWSDRTERALYYLIRAGKKSAASFVSEQAQQHFLQALLLLPKTAHTQEQEWDIHSGLGDVLTLLGDYHTANEHFMAALAICNNEGDGSYARMSALHRKIARTLERQGMYDQALKFLDDARQSLSVDSPDGKMEMAQVLNDTGWINYRLGKFPEAEQLLNNALSLVENSNELDAIASIYNRLGGLAYNQGDWNKTSEYLRKSIAIRDSIGDVVGLANSMNNLALLAIEIGDYPTALENLTRSYELKKRLGQAEGISTALNNIAWLRIQRGEITEAQECLAQALDLARQIGYTMLEGQVLKNYGEMHLEAQKWEAARKSLREAVFIFESLGAHDQLIDTYRLLGEAALGIGNINEGQSCADSIQAMTVSLNDGTRELSSIQRGEFWRFRGMLATHQGDWDSAAHFLNESEQIFRVLGVRLYQGRAAMQLGRLAETRGDMYTALHRYREAELLFRSVGASAAEERSHRAAQRQSA